MLTNNLCMDVHVSVCTLPFLMPHQVYKDRGMTGPTDERMLIGPSGVRALPLGVAA